MLCVNCLQKHVFEGSIDEKIEVMRRRGRRGKQLLDDLNEKRGYWRPKKEAPDRPRWRTHFGRGYGPVVRQYTELIIIIIIIIIIISSGLSTNGHSV